MNPNIVFGIGVFFAVFAMIFFAREMWAAGATAIGMASGLILLASALHWINTSNRR